MAVAESSPPATAAAAAGQTHAGRVDALERMLTRLALTEDSVASLLCRFLPYTTISLVSPGASVRELLMENGSLFDKLVKQRPDISMMMDLWRIYTESTSTVVQNYCIVYVEMGFERLLSEDKGSIAPDLLINISNVPEQHQGIILRLVLKAIGECDTHKVDQTVASKYKSISASNDGLVFADFCLHMILYQTPPQGIRCPAGLSVAQSDRVTGNLPLKGDTLASRKLGILDVIETMQFKVEIVYPLYLAAASDSQKAVAKRGEEMLILKASAVNLEDSDLIKRLFTLFNGTASSENIASELEVAPAHSSLRVRLMGVFCRSIAAANAFTHTFQCIFGCIYGNGTTSRLKQLGMEFTVWVFKHAANDQLKLIGPVILSGILRSLDGSSTTEADSSSRDIRIFAYQAIGLLAFRMPNLFCNKTGMAIWLFTALRLEEQSLRSIIQEAATALATEYKLCCGLRKSQEGSRKIVLHVPWTEGVRMGFVDYGIVAAREMALAGLNLLNDERQSSTMATDISYPDIAEMVNYIYSQQPQLLHCYEQRNGKLLFPTDTFLAMIKFLMKCFQKSDGSDFLQEDLSNSTLAKMCVLLEYAMSYDGSSELHTLALKSLVDISSRQPKMVSSFYVNRLDWPRTLLHADSHEEAPRLLGIASTLLSIAALYVLPELTSIFDQNPPSGYGRQCQNTTDINEELGSCCNGRTNHSLEHEVCGGGNNSDNLGGDGCDEELVTGCHHRHGRIDHNLEFLIDRMMSWSVRDILKAPPVIKKAQTTFVSIDNYFESLCIEAVALTTAQLKMPLQLLGTANWHDVKLISEVQFPYYLLDIVHIPTDCYKNRCHTIRRGDLILLDPTSPYSKKPKGCFFAVAVEDEDEYFRSAFKVQIIRKSRPVDLVINYAALLDINIQGQVEFWSSIHQDIDNKCQCIINSILQAPLVVFDKCTSEKSSSNFDVPNPNFRDDLDEYQLKAFKGITTSLSSCRHFEHTVELIKGSPRTGKTRLLSALLLSLTSKFQCVVYAPSLFVITDLLHEIQYLGGKHNQFDNFCKKTIVLERKSDIGPEFGHLTLESYLDDTNMCFVFPGWKFFINMALDILDKFGPKYKVFRKRREISFLDMFKKEFILASKQLKERLRSLKIWLPKLCLHNESTTEMIKVLDEIEDLLGNRNLNCGIAEELNDKRMKCAQLLRKFKEDLQSIDLPTFKTREDLEEFCMKNSSIIFCSTNNSFHLREIQLKIDCLIIDSANLFNEYETLVPLCLPSLHSIILAGDEAKKPTVGNQVYQQDAFGVSLFQRLLDLGFNQHLLLDQYITGQHGRRVSSKSKVLKPEFTWIERPHNRKYILAPIRDQGPKDFNVILDMQDMLLQYKEETGYTYGDELRGERGQIRLEKALQTLKKRGVRGIDGCDNNKKMEQIRISSFRRIDIEAEGFEQIFERLLQGRMLVGSFKVSCNYFELAEGEVYPHFLGSFLGSPTSAAVMVGSVCNRSCPCGKLLCENLYSIDM
uniref:Uncharacterized protein n=1 Tax=Oryza barthii TaxID=65489 RepID=A0A0D3HRG1_9ORYZ